MRKSNFTDDQRAEIYARDRAICAYSGKSLWLADFGAAPSSVDWIDHFRAVARGGKSTLDNGVCASWLYNSIKRQHCGALRLFSSGYPTTDYYLYYESLEPEIAAHLARFAALHPSDWFFNRALFHVLLGVKSIGARRADGEPLTRGTEYRAKAALNYFSKWRQRSEDVTHPRRRGLFPKRPSEDQKLLLSAEHLATVAQLQGLMKKLYPFWDASWNALAMAGEVRSKDEAMALARTVSKHRHVVPRVKRAIVASLRRLSFRDA